MLKTVVLLYIVVETGSCLMTKKETEIFCNIINIFTVMFN